MGCSTGLDGGKDVFDACLGDDLVFRLWKALRRGLEYELAMYAGEVALLLNQNPAS